MYTLILQSQTNHHLLFCTLKNKIEQMAFHISFCSKGPSLKNQAAGKYKIKQLHTKYQQLQPLVTHATHFM